MELTHLYEGNFGLKDFDPAQILDVAENVHVLSWKKSTFL